METRIPWGLTKMTARLPVADPPYARVELDFATQTGRYYAVDGEIIEAGRHGTNRTVRTASMSGGGDGAKPQPRVADDTTVDFESD